MVGTIPTSAQPLQSRLEQETIAVAGTGVLGEDWERVRASTIEAESLEGVKGPKMRRSLRAEGVIEIVIDLQRTIDRSMSKTPLNPEELRRQGHMMVDFIADYYKNIEQYPVLSQVEPGYLRRLLPESAPYTGEPIDDIISDIQKHIIPGITHWQHPNHFAYFPCTSSTAGFVGELLAAGFNVVGFSWVASPAATELEIIVIDWLGKMLNLPRTFLFSGGTGGGGVIMGTTCEALLATLVAARDQKLSSSEVVTLEKLVVYCSDQTHCAFQKAAQIVGIKSGNVRVIPTTKATSFGMAPESLESAILLDLENEFVPLFLCATVGTTPTGAVDPLGAICHVANKHGLWIHVDAAYAGSACICPEFRHYIDGVEGDFEQKVSISQAMDRASQLRSSRPS
ncbi:Tyrosine decarboxylase [Linum perenne]